MKTSKFVQLDPNVLMEYIYEDSFLHAENYIVTHNLNEDNRSFAPKDNTGSNNRYSNNLVLLDPVTLKSGIRNSEQYNFLLDKEYTQNLPIGYDRVKLHFPINFNFGEYAGCYLRVYVMDYNNTELINLSSYYFDKQDQDRFNKELQLSSPPNTLNGKLWGKYIEIAYPSPSIVSLQRTNNVANPNSINYNISGGKGISNISPIMIEFGFMTKKDEINNVVTYLLRSPYQTSVPQTPDYENLALRIEPSIDGDWFDIFGTYNGASSEFNRWIQTSIAIGKRYYVEYTITMFEENIKGKSLNVIINQDFNEHIEFRPIIKYSSTTAAIEVIMKVIDQVDGSIIERMSSYGMLPNEISKYSRSLVRINVEGIKTPKIYNLRSGGSVDSDFEGLNNRKFSQEIFGDDIETVKVPYPILVNNNNIIAKSDSTLYDDKLWNGYGDLKIIVDPFDNIFKFVLAKSIDDNTVEYFNLLDIGDINIHFKNYSIDIDAPLYRKSGEIDLENGIVVFKLDKNKVNSVRRIYQSGVNMFYITSTNDETSETTVIYEGTFIMSDSIEYVQEKSDNYTIDKDNIKLFRNNNQEYAVVTRRLKDTDIKGSFLKSQLINDIKIASDAILRKDTSFAVVSNDSQINTLTDFLNNRNIQGTNTGGNINLGNDGLSDTE